MQLIALFSLLSLWLLPSEAQTITRNDGGSKTDSDVPVSSEDYLWTYFETPLSRDVEHNGGHLGPTHWKDLKIPNNQCGGGGMKNGFGQSPVVISYTYINEECDSNLDGYETFNGTCTWSDLDYAILKDGLQIKQKYDPPLCSLGSFKIPDNRDALYEITELRFKTGAGHVLEGSVYSNEFEIFAQEKDGYSQAAFSIPTIVNFTVGSEADHKFPKEMLNGWANSFWERHDECEERNQEGSGMFNVNTVLEQKQEFWVCEDFDDREFAETAIPIGKSSSYSLIPNYASELISQSMNLNNNFHLKGLFSYKGSLNRPPCTENVFWNVVLNPIAISQRQYIQIVSLINCFKEESTCDYASAASEFGKTTRPPQPLNGRKIIRRCDGGPETDLTLPGEVLNPVAKYNRPKEFSPYYALLFPFFILTMSLVIFYVLTRYVHMIPYTAVLFLLGTVMGLVTSSTTLKTDQLSSSTLMFEKINGNLLLLGFLPGLLFKDAYCLDIHLFFNAFSQVVIMGFPMVSRILSCCRIFSCLR